MKPPYEPEHARSTQRNDVRELPGRKVRFSALLSEDQKHRFTLARSWDESLSKLLWIGLNPARADFAESDRSSERVIAYARDHGFGRIDVGNLLSVRQPKPNLVPADDAVRPEADVHLQGMIEAADQIAVGWGSGLVPLKEQRIAQVLQMCSGRDLYSFGDPLKYGQPRHPATRRGALPTLSLWLAADQGLGVTARARSLYGPAG